MRVGGIYIEEPEGEHREIDALEWGRRLNGDRTIGHEWVGRFEVSTVWIGISSNLKGPPEIYETMIFEDGDRSKDRLQTRYSFRSEAIAGHALALVVAAALKPSKGPRPPICQVRRPLTQIRRGTRRRAMERGLL